MALEMLMQEAQGLSDDAITLVIHFIEFLKAESLSSAMHIEKDKENNPKIRKAGILRGQIKMSDDFDAPLDDFREYMS